MRLPAASPEPSSSANAVESMPTESLRNRRSTSRPAFHDFFFSSRRRHTRYIGDWSSDVCSSDLRIIRQLVGLLDERIPVIAGSEINDDPFSPISAYGRQTIEREGDHTPINWISADAVRSEERRVGKECRTRWAQCK